MPTRFIWLGLAISLILIPPASAAPREDAILPRLQSALAQPAHPWRQEDGRLAVWVYFTDKGFSGGTLVARLEAKERSLSPRIAARRARMRAPGAHLADTRDLPVHAPYLALVATSGARPRHQSRWLNAASFDCTDQQIAAIARLPFVRWVDLVVKHRRRPLPEQPVEETTGRDRTDEKSNGWTLDYGGSLFELEQINVPPVHEMGFRGQGVVIGMLDAGFKTTHEALRDIPILATRDFVDGDDDATDTPGHGSATLSTAMGRAAGRLVGPAFGASAILARTEDALDEYPLEEDNWVAGLEWCESLGADIISSSLGYYYWYEFSDLDGETAVTTIAADLAVGRGLVVVTSAGNERGAPTNFGHIIAPADGDSVITVGAVNARGLVTFFSSPGPTYDGRIKPDVCALGSANHTTMAAQPENYVPSSGTSFSCPLVSGVAALVLSRVPSLTPIEVREALSQTADHAQAPDNDYGWGIVDALAAVTYWGPLITHDPLPDREDPTGPYEITAAITGRLPLDPTGLWLFHRAGNEDWQRLALEPVSGDLFAAALLERPAGTTIEYYLEAADTAELVMQWPASGPEQPHRFTVGPDLQPPNLTHEPLFDQPYLTWPPRIVAAAGDNLGIDRVELIFTLDAGAENGPFPLPVEDDGSFSLEFPLDADEITPGNLISYSVTAWDTAAEPNAAFSGFFTFAIIDAPGVVLIIDDDQVEKSAMATEYSAGTGRARESDTSAAVIARWLTHAGYIVDSVTAEVFEAEHLVGHQLVIYSAGDNPLPMGRLDVSLGLRDWALAGGKVLVEGGALRMAVGRAANRGFRQLVHHSVSWSGCTGDLVPAPGQELHPLLAYPHVLPVPLEIDGDSLPNKQESWHLDEMSYPVALPAGCTDVAGIYIYDNDELARSAQNVILALDITAVSDPRGRQLIENAVSFLLMPQRDPSATIAGRVTLEGQSDHSGVTVSCGDGPSVETGRHGLFNLGPLHAGTYEVTARKPGYAPTSERFTIDRGEQQTGADLALVWANRYALRPEATIPDGGPGLISMINVPEADTLLGLSIDIVLSHGRSEDLTIQLLRPGARVTLHARGEGSEGGITGNWPETLQVEGPGSLAEFAGLPVQGDWILFIQDETSGETGTLHSWGLNLRLSEPILPDPPSTTRLVSIAPNPFNAGTEVNFDLRRPGRIRLDVYDIRGRRVRRLFDAVLPAGAYAEPWDGRNDLGRTLGSGIYLVGLRAGGVSENRKVTLLR